MLKREGIKFKPYNYLKAKKALQESHQLPGNKSTDKQWEAEVRKKEDEDELNPPNKSPEELVKSKEGDYDYYKIKKAIYLR